MFQIQNDSHVVAFKDDKIVGYLSWLHTTEEITLAWQDEAAPLVVAKNPTAIVVTILAVDEPSFIRPIL